MRKHLLVPFLICLLAFVVAACGEDEEPSGGGGTTTSASGGEASDPVKFTFIADQAGPGGLYGKAVLEGAQLNVDRINGEGGINGHKLEMEVVDSASDQAQATAAITKVARGEDDAALYGVLSQSALAMGPIAQREKIPFLVSYSQVPEVTKPGDFIYRTSTSEGEWYDGMVKYLAEQKDMKKMTIYYASDNATAVTNTEKVVPGLAEKHGVEIVDKVSVKSTDTDFSSTASKIAEQNPDGVMVLILGAGVNTAITALRRAGYEGVLFGSSALGAGALAAAGEDAANTYYPSSILASEEVPWESGKAFLELFKEKNGKDPTAFHAAGYDQVQLLAEAVGKVDGEVTRESLHAALAEVKSAGFSGATGDPVKFDDNRIAVTPGLLVLWDGKKETFAPDQPVPFFEGYDG